jgi:hypothetical protein
MVANQACEVEYDAMQVRVWYVDAIVMREMREMRMRGKGCRRLLRSGETLERCLDLSSSGEA